MPESSVFSAAEPADPDDRRLLVLVATVGVNDAPRVAERRDLPRTQ